MNSLLDEFKRMGDSMILGEQDSPIGYTKNADGIYTFNPNYLTVLDSHISNLNNLKAQLSSDFNFLFSKKISSELKKLAGLRESYLKNVITETMLKTISDPANLIRMTTPISFNPIIEAYSTIPEELRPGRNNDLSNISHKQEAYSSLAAGQILTGAFANSVKVFAYLLRSSDEGSFTSFVEAQNRQSGKLYKLEAIKNRTQDEEKEYQELIENLPTIRELLAQTANEEAQKAVPGILREEQHFRLQTGAGVKSFNKIALTDTNGRSTTQVFDTLINSAIDNLKLGYLAQARINSLSGSATVGFTALGVPLDITTKIFYQPIFKDLFSGKVNKVESWAAEIKEKYKKELDSLDTNLDILTLEELNRGLRESIDPANTGSLMAQLKAFDIFMKASKVGEDIRNLADFMNIIRQMPVFIEDIDGVQTNLTNKIGTVLKVEDTTLFLTKPSFSFNIPFLFINNPHIAEAYDALDYLQSIIRHNFAVHNTFTREFAKVVATNTNLQSTEELSSADANLAHMRRNLVSYFLSNIVWPSIEDAPQKKAKLPNTDIEITYSKARTYSEQVASDLKAVRVYCVSHNIPNKFLRYALINTNEYGVTVIRFKGGVNLSSTDVQEIGEGFKQLNKFDVQNGEVTQVDRLPNQVSKLQEDLLNYAILNFGLQFSSNNYSSFIPATMFKSTAQELDRRLDDIDKPGLAAHFELSYVLQNGERLPFTSRESSVPFYSYEDAKGRKVNVYNGVDLVNGVKIFYDRKVEFTPRNEDQTPKFSRYIKTSFSNRVVVFKLVKVIGNTGYYQRVGKTSEVFYSPLTLPNYKISDYYNPEELTLGYTDITPVGPNTFKLSSFLIPGVVDGLSLIQKGDEFWGVPAYNFDRTQRVKYKLLSAPVRIRGKSEAYSYVVEEVKTTPLTEEEQIINDLEKKCDE